MRIHVYLLIENLGLPDNQRDTLVAALQGLGREESGIDRSRRIQVSIRLDNQAVILEAAFDDTDFTLAAMKARLAALFGVAASSINTVVTVLSFRGGSSTQVVFSRLGVDYLRLIAFGTLAGSWDQSKNETQGYIAAHAVAWGWEVA